MTRSKDQTPPSTVIGYIETPSGRVAFADVVDCSGVTHYRTRSGQCVRRAAALAAPHWTAATWPQWMPRRSNGGIPQRLPGWVTRSAPKERLR